MSTLLGIITAFDCLERDPGLVLRPLPSLSVGPHIIERDEGRPGVIGAPGLLGLGGTDLRGINWLVR